MQTKRAAEASLPKENGAGVALMEERIGYLHEFLGENGEKHEALKQQAKRGDLFSDTPEYFSVVNKLPYKFSYRLLDDKGKESTMMIEDWEIGMLFWNCLKRHHGDEKKAILDVRKKYIDDFANTKDLHLFLGTTLQYDGWAQNPFIIIGVFAPPITQQTELF